MKQHLNTLFITREGAWLFKDGETVCVKLEGKVALRLPLHNLDGIVTMGWDIGMSPHLMGACAEAGISVSFCNPHGRFLAAVTGFTPGNVLLRREQYRRADDESASLSIAGKMIAAKIANCRTVLLRAMRDHNKTELTEACDILAQSSRQACQCLSRAELLGVEGFAADTYFSVFRHCQTGTEEKLLFTTRSRRPPLDAVNALLSFLYSMLAHDARSALESCGLDAAVGFLHRDRSGRPGLALDMMEEFRPLWADRLALSLLNRKQITEKDFNYERSGAVFLKEDSRKLVIAAWQERKQEVVTHPFLEEKMTVGLFIHIQARLLARHLRGDLDAYPPFIVK